MATKFILEGDSPKLIEDPPKRGPLLGEGELGDELIGKLRGHISSQMEGKRESVTVPIKFILRSLMGEQAYQDAYNKMPDEYKKGVEEEIAIAAPIGKNFGPFAGLASKEKQGLYGNHPLTRRETFSSDIFINPALVEKNVGNQTDPFFKDLTPEERKNIYKETMLHEVRHKLVTNLFGKTTPMPFWMGMLIAKTPSGNSIDEVFAYSKDILGRYNDVLKKEGKKPVNIVGEDDAIGITTDAVEKYLDHMAKERKKKKFSSKDFDDMHSARKVYMLLEVLNNPEILDEAPENSTIKSILPDKKTMLEELTPFKNELNHLLKTIVQVKETKDGPTLT